MSRSPIPTASRARSATCCAARARRFLVLCFPGAAPPALPSGLARAYACNAALGALPVLRGEGLARLGGAGEVLVVRPDQHVAARLTRPDAVAAAIYRALGQETR